MKLKKYEVQHDVEGEKLIILTTNIGKYTKDRSIYLVRWLEEMEVPDDVLDEMRGERGLQIWVIRMVFLLIGVVISLMLAPLVMK